MAEMIMKRQQTLAKETFWFTVLAALLVISTLGGLINQFASSDFSIWQQINVLLHIIVGTLAILPLLIYSGVHIKRTLGVRSLWVTILGFLCLIILLALFISGILIGSFGQQERFILITQSHNILAYIFLFLLFLHITVYWFIKQKKHNTLQFLTINRRSIQLISLSPINI